MSVDTKARTRGERSGCRNGETYEFHLCHSREWRFVKRLHTERLPQPGDHRVHSAALCWGAGVGPAGFRKLVACCRSAGAVLDADASDLQHADPRLSREQIELITGLTGRLDEFARRISLLEQSGVQVLTVDASGYPGGFRALRNPPPIVCLRGGLAPQDRHTVAVVGTRRPTHSEAVRTERMVRALVRAGITVVSGLAVGVDGAAHRAALGAGGHTIAVLGSGIQQIYPSQHIELASMVAQTGSVLSELAPDCRVSVAALIARNRLIAALGALTVVVASDQRGGSLVTAREAHRLGKPVATFADEPGYPARAGNHMLLQHGAVALDGDNPDELCQLVHHTAANQSLSTRSGHTRPDSTQMTLFAPPHIP